MTSIAERLLAVRRAIDRAASESDRDPREVQLIAVSKLHPADAAADAVAAGQVDLGENYAQELRDKARIVAGARWHMIGPLQRNKVKYVVGTAALVHTIDTITIADEVARRAGAMGVRQRCLIQVNVGAEQQKSGCAPGDVAELVDHVRALPSLELAGFMCIPPAGSIEVARACFADLAAIRRATEQRVGAALPDLSMGMSADFTQAIAEGSTMVRIGTAIFGERPSSPRGA